jgi:hypothetical protein
MYLMNTSQPLQIKLQPKSHQVTDPLMNTVNLSTILSACLSSIPITTKELLEKNSLKKLKDKKSCDTSGISSQLLKIIHSI